MGMLLSAIGIQARSAITKVITSSKGCISPICLLPIIRIIIRRVTNIIVALINIINIIIVFKKAVFLYIIISRTVDIKTQIKV